MAKLFVEIGAKIGEFQKSLNRIERDIGKFGRKMKRLGYDLTTSISGPLAAVGVLSVKAFADFEQTLAKVQAVSGATGKEFDSLKTSARELGRTTQFTASQVGDLQLNLSKLGFSPTEINQSTAAILDLALATGENLAESATVAAATLRGFQLPAEEMSRVVNVMADSFSSTALDLEKFGTSMSVLAPVAEVAGASIEQTTALMGILANAGVDASTIGTGLRNVFLDLADQGLTLGEAMSQVRDSTNPLATSMELFGKRGATVATIIANNREQIVGLTDDFNDAAGEARGMASIMEDTLQGSFIRLQSAVEGAGISLGEVIAPALRRAADAVNGLVSRFNELSPTTKQIIVVVGGLAAAIGPALIAIGLMASGISALAGVSALLLSPVTLVVAAIAAVAAGLIIAYNKSETFRKGVNGVINVINELGLIAGDVVANLAKGFAALADFRFEDAFDSFNDALTNINPIAGLAEEGGGRLGRAFAEGFADESSRIDEGLNSIKQKISDASSGILTGVTTGGTSANLDRIVGGAKTGGGSGGNFRAQVEAIKTSLSSITPLQPRDLIPESIEPATRRVAENVGLIGRSLESLGASAEVVFSEGEGAIAEKMERLKNTTQALAEIAGGILTQGFSDFFTTILEGGSNVFDGFINAIKKLVVQLAAAVATAAALAAIFTIISGGGAAGLVKIKSLLGFTEGSLFKNFLKIPGFAHGGIVPPGFPNDSYLARLSSGEAVIPLNKLNQYSGGTTNVTGEFRISGPDLIAAVERNTFNRERLTGK